MEKSQASRVTSKGQITIPKMVRQALHLKEGDRVVFVDEEGKMVIKKAALVAFQEFAVAISQEAVEKGIREEDLLEDLKRVRKEMWNERTKQ